VTPNRQALTEKPWRPALREKSEPSRYRLILVFSCIIRCIIMSNGLKSSGKIGRIFIDSKCFGRRRTDIQGN
jgi:hypothetical protein